MLRAGSKRGVAGRVGSWSARHKKSVLAAWLVFIVASVVLGGAVGTNGRAAGQSRPCTSPRRGGSRSR